MHVHLQTASWLPDRDIFNFDGVEQTMINWSADDFGNVVKWTAGTEGTGTPSLQNAVTVF